MPITKTPAQSESNQQTFHKRFFSLMKAYQIWIILILGMVVGLVFVFSVPPWMHYDEPGHFEYAWLIANKPGLPEDGDYDQDLRRQISGSIIEADIEGYTGMTTDPLQIDEPITIWVTHIGNHPPTYYLLASLPLRLVKHSDVAFQLHIVRLVSLGLFLVFIWVSHRVSKTLFDESHPMTWMVPLFLVTLPSFVDIMTAANNDVLAILSFSLFFWASVEILKKGGALFRFAALGGTVVLCILSKNTAWLAAPLSLLVLLFVFFRGKKYEKYVWVALGISGVLGLASLFSWRERVPAFFYSQVPAARPITVEVTGWELGDRVITQKSQQRSQKSFYNLLSPEDTAQISSKRITLGAWIWADEPTSLSVPGIQEGLTIEPLLTSAPVSTRNRLRIPLISERSLATPINIKFSTSGSEISDSAPDSITLSTMPQFYTFTAVLPPMGDNITWVYFNPSTDEGNRVYWDGIVLVEGDFTDAGEPIFDDVNASRGTWGSVPFNNMIKNASGEAHWPVFAGWVSRLLPERTFLATSDILSIFDFKATSLYFQYTAERLFRTFWAVFGWANVPMYGQKPYRFFFLLSFIYLGGILFGLIRKSTLLSWKAQLLLAAVVLLQVMMVVMRGVGSWFSQTYIPVARYIYPTILPLGILMTDGIHQIIQSLGQKTSLSNKVLYGALIGLHLGIILWAMRSISIFYNL